MSLRAAGPVQRCERHSVSCSSIDIAMPAGSDDEESEGSRYPLLVRLVRIVVFGIPKRVLGFMLSVVNFLRSRRSKW